MPMTGRQSFIKLDPRITMHAPEFHTEKIWKDECFYTHLQKAKHGCAQASSLWYTLIRARDDGIGV